QYRYSCDHTDENVRCVLNLSVWQVQFLAYFFLFMPKCSNILTQNFVIVQREPNNKPITSQVLILYFSDRQLLHGW
ncbi:hypothetical protein C0J52_18307, partial [Blattella germanica]